MTELTIENGQYSDGCSKQHTILFSYETPVAGWDDMGAFESEDYYSVTTSKHINKYFGGKERRTDARKVSQSFINELVGE